MQLAIRIMSAAHFVFVLVLVLVLFHSSYSAHLPNDDADALVAFKSSLENPRPLFSWKEGTLPCRDGWIGVFCIKDTDTIIRIHLPRMGLSGSLDPAVKALTPIESLRTISLINNSLTGPLPDSFKGMKRLRALYLSGNRLSGVISNDFFSGMDSLSRVWLASNDFTGKIPESLGKLPHLRQLHLEKNQFSGEIPDISQPGVSDLDMSNNKLEGRIPDNMAARFGGKAFAGNSGVCGKGLGLELECKKPVHPSDRGRDRDSMMNTVDLMVCIAVVMIILLLANMDIKLRKEKPEEEETTEFSVRHNSPLPPLLPARPKYEDVSSKKGIAELVIINEDKGVFGFADLMKAAAEVLDNGNANANGLGSSYKALMDNGGSVVVKRIKDMNQLAGKRAFDAQMLTLARVRHPNILTPLAYHYRKEEKLVISETISKGSLSYVLHGERGASHSNLNWETRLNILKGIASGIKFLHEEYGWAHGNLKSSNVLLGDKYEALINDHGYLPFLTANQAKQGMFGFKTPEAIETDQVTPKSDVYCLGIIMLEVITGKFPSEYLSAGRGGTSLTQWLQSAIQQGKEVELLDPEIASANPSAQPSILQLLRLAASCTELDPHQRPTMSETIAEIEEIQSSRPHHVNINVPTTHHSVQFA